MTIYKLVILSGYQLVSLSYTSFHKTRTKKNTLYQFQSIFLRRATLLMSLVVALKKDGSKAIIWLSLVPKPRWPPVMCCSPSVYTFLWSVWQAFLNKQARHSPSPFNQRLCCWHCLSHCHPQCWDHTGQEVRRASRWGREGTGDTWSPVLSMVKGEWELGESTVPKTPVYRRVQVICPLACRNF